MAAFHLMMLLMMESGARPGGVIGIKYG